MNPIDKATSGQKKQVEALESKSNDDARVSDNEKRVALSTAVEEGEAKISTVVAGLASAAAESSGDEQTVMTAEKAANRTTDAVAAGDTEVGRKNVMHDVGGAAKKEMRTPRGPYYLKRRPRQRELHVFVPIGPSLKSSDIRVAITSTTLLFQVKDQEPIIDGVLAGTVVAEDSYWEIGSDNGQRCARVVLIRRSGFERGVPFLVSSR